MDFSPRLHNTRNASKLSDVSPQKNVSITMVFPSGLMEAWAIRGNITMHVAHPRICITLKILDDQTYAWVELHRSHHFFAFLCTVNVHLA